MKNNDDAVYQMEAKVRETSCGWEILQREGLLEGPLERGGSLSEKVTFEQILEGAERVNNGSLGKEHSR